MVKMGLGANMQKLQDRSELNNNKRHTQFRFDLNNYSLIEGAYRNLGDPDDLNARFDFELDSGDIDDSKPFPDNIFQLYEYPNTFAPKFFYPIVFMTHLECSSSRFCVLNIKKIKEKRKELRKLIFIDPAVLDLRDYHYYVNESAMIGLIESTLREHEFISLDYPVDFARDENESLEFVEKSYENNMRWKDNLHYICCIQSRHNDYDDFVLQYERLRPIFANKKKILGIGGACSHTKRPNEFTDKVFNYLSEHASEIYWVHFYGIKTPLISAYIDRLQMYAPLRISFDSTQYQFLADSSLYHEGFGMLPIGSKTKPLYLKIYLKQLMKSVKTQIIW
jgi:hypothetical protein